MDKIACDLLCTARTMLTPHHALLTLRADEPLPKVSPGQFANVRVAGSPATFLRRPVSIHDYDGAATVQLLVHAVGDGTRRLCELQVGERLDCVLPLGRGFTLPDTPLRALLVGGGVGVAPLYLLGVELVRRGCDVTFLLGGKTEADILRREAFEAVGRVCLTTEDGSAGTRGFVTHSPAMGERYDFIYTCGPKPMMQAVGRAARQSGTPCEVSLENMMACGLGACLCCVEKTTTGNRCVCTDGPVFNTQELIL
ncbi:MAG: dihydroorotate dehydrogenase electron transfer subunit [Bacteroidaceae bacterium]|nr:dihydroorotate dehydrogenase electron transfer subunit [Bacteroidaceae bacterium]